MPQKKKRENSKSPKRKKAVIAELPPEKPKFALPDGEVDLLKDINEEFFNSGNKMVQALMQENRSDEAGQIKKVVNLIDELHAAYTREVKETASLRPQVEEANFKFRLALELTGSSQESMNKLKDALGDAWKKSDASQIREQDTQDKLQELLIKCEKMDTKNISQTDDAEFGHLVKYKNIILRERDRLNGEVIDLEKRLQFQRYYAEAVEYINGVADDTNNKMKLKMQTIEADRNNLEKKSQILNHSLNEFKEANKNLVLKLNAQNNQISDMQFQLSHKTTELEKNRIQFDKIKGDNTAINRQLIKMEVEIEKNKKERKSFEELVKELRADDKMKADAIAQLAKKYKKSCQNHDSLAQRMHKMDRNNADLKEDIVRQKAQMNILEKDLLTSAQNLEELQRMKDYVTREREGLRSDVAKLNNQINDLRHTNLMQINTIDNLKLDINKLNVKLDEARRSISKAEKERDEMAQEVESLHERIDYFQEQVQLKTDQIIDLTEKLAVKHANYIKIQKRLETTNSERIMLQRTLETCSQERDDLKLLQTQTMHQMALLQNEISANQNTINSLNLRIERLGTEKKELQSELKNTQTILQNVRDELKEMKTKNERLQKTIADDELRFMNLSHELEETRKEKNLIGLQMVRRNDEIILLKERLSIVQTALDRGQVQYNQRMEDIRLMKTEITNLQTERDVLSRGIKSTANMREEVIRLQRALNQEKVKCRSLTEDVQIPANVHRWRILKGSEPNKYLLLKKIQTLQKRNLKQNIAKSKLEQKLLECEKLVEKLKKALENSPNENIMASVNKAQHVLRKREKKLKVMAAELYINDVDIKMRDSLIRKAAKTITLKSMFDQRQSITAAQWKPIVQVEGETRKMATVPIVDPKRLQRMSTSSAHSV